MRKLILLTLIAFVLLTLSMVVLSVCMLANDPETDPKLLEELSQIETST